MFKKLFGFGKKDDAVDEVSEELIEEVAEDNENDVEGSIEEQPEQEADIEPIEECVEEVVEEVLEETIEEPVEELIEEIGEDIVEEYDEINEEPESIGFFGKLKAGLSKTQKAFTDKIDNLVNNYGEIDEDLLEELEEILIMADIGMETTMKLIDELRTELEKRKIKDASQVKHVLRDVMETNLNQGLSSDLNVDESPAIILVIGVNGAGKTTSIGKIAHNLKKDGKKVLLGAGDTFRAAAIDQLKVWSDRVDVDIISHQEGSDPAAVIYDSIQAAKARNIDVLICDTAGRLHNKKNLMNELAKIFKIIEREWPEAKKEVLLVLDATTGQNAVQQAKYFKETADITGIVLTKLDGTAKGGVVIGIQSELQIPVKLIGVGEGKDDLQKFVAHEFVSALLDEAI